MPIITVFILPYLPPISLPKNAPIERPNTGSKFIYYKRVEGLLNGLNNINLKSLNAGLLELNEAPKDITERPAKNDIDKM